MKTRYALVRNNDILYETSTLADLHRVKEEFDSGRRSGRTTRMLFQALGDSSECVLIIGQSSMMVSFLFNQMAEMLTSLGFEFTVNKEEKSLTNIGKTYYFKVNGQVNYRDPKFRDISRYMDEK